MTVGKGFVTHTAFKKHLDGDWRTVHELWNHIRNYMGSYAAPDASTYSKTEIDAFFEGYSGGKAQVDAGNVVGLTQGSIPFADASGFLTEDNSNLFWDAANVRLAIGHSSPAADCALHIEFSAQESVNSRVAAKTRPWRQWVCLDGNWGLAIGIHADDGKIHLNYDTPIGTRDQSMIVFDGPNARVGILNDAPTYPLDIGGNTRIAGSGATELKVETSGQADPFYCLKTTFTDGNGDIAHEVHFALDQDAAADHVDFIGQTASVDTYFHVIGQSGQTAKVGVQIDAFRGELICGSAGHVSLKNITSDLNLIFGIKDGATNKTITWNAADDKLQHSHGLFNFDDDNILTTGTLGAGVATFTGLTVTDYIYFDKDTEHVVLFGFECGKNLAGGGTYHFFAGEQAGYSATTSDFNVAIGYQALYRATTGGQNVAIGYQALLGLDAGATTYLQNVAIGYEAGEWIDAGATGNMLIGLHAGRNIQTGNYNMFIGSGAGYYQRGSNNVAIGSSALHGTGDSTATGNISIGTSAGHGIGTGAAYNINIGTNSGYFNSSGDYNIAIGYRAGQGASGQNYSFNVFIGVDAGKVVNTAGSCVMIGYLSGAAVTTGGDHILIGESAGKSLTTETGCVMIGHAAGENATASNVLYIANSNTVTPLIYGEFDNAYLLINGRLAVAYSTIGDDERGLSSIHTLSDNPAKSDGIGFYSEGHIGAITTDGPTYGAGIWLNIDTGATLGADVRALDIGIYEAGADCAGRNAYGLAIHMEFDDTDPPAAIYPLRINCNDTPGHATPAGLIFAPNPSALGLVAGDPGTADDAYLKIVLQDGSVYRIPLVKE